MARSETRHGLFGEYTVNIDDDGREVSTTRREEPSLFESLFGAEAKDVTRDNDGAVISTSQKESGWFSTYTSHRNSNGDEIAREFAHEEGLLEGLLAPPGSASQSRTTNVDGQEIGRTRTQEAGLFERIGGSPYTFKSHTALMPHHAPTRQGSHDSAQREQYSSTSTEGYSSYSHTDSGASTSFFGIILTVTVVGILLIAAHQSARQIRDTPASPLQQGAPFAGEGPRRDAAQQRRDPDIRSPSEAAAPPDPLTSTRPRRDADLTPAAPWTNTPQEAPPQHSVSPARPHPFAPTLNQPPVIERNEAQLLTAAQRRLAALGFDPGPADGAMGPRTRRALSAFQAAEGLPSTGTLDTPTFAALEAAILDRRRPLAAPQIRNGPQAQDGASVRSPSANCVPFGGVDVCR
jgi:hypothetical protein